MNENTTQDPQPPYEPRPSATREFPAVAIKSTMTLRDLGYQEAGFNNGHVTALESNLRKISTGHLVDGTIDENEELMYKKQVEKNLTEKENDRNGKHKDQQHIKDVLIPDTQSEKNKMLKDIEDKKKQMAEGKIRSKYSRARFSLYTLLVSIISLYLIFFYASAMNAAFFRSMASLVNNSDTNDITLMLNSIFDAHGIFVLSPHLIFVYLGAFLFFGFGILPHVFNDKSKFAILKIVMALLVCLAIDGLIAYKIDSGIHELKTMMNMADENWAWYKSANFYLVLAFGFGVYLLWGFLYEAAHAEHDKKNVNAIAEIEIAGLKKNIRTLEKQILEHQAAINELQKAIDALQLEIDRLKKQLDSAMLKPETLLRNMEHFYNGWLHFLNGTHNGRDNIDPCDATYQKFRQSILVENPHLN